MTRQGQRFLIIVGLVLLMSVGFGMMATILRENLNGYSTPKDLLNSELQLGDNLSVGGVVVPGTLKPIDVPLGSEFVISDGVANLRVVRAGSLPDLFAEGELTEIHGPIVDLSPLTVQATKVLAKHDQYYVPVQAQDAVNDLRKEVGPE